MSTLHTPPTAAELRATLRIAVRDAPIRRVKGAGYRNAAGRFAKGPIKHSMVLMGLMRALGMSPIEMEQIASDAVSMMHGKALRKEFQAIIGFEIGAIHMLETEYSDDMSKEFESDAVSDAEEELYFSRLNSGKRAQELEILF